MGELNTNQLLLLDIIIYITGTNMYKTEDWGTW